MEHHDTDKEFATSSPAVLLVFNRGSLTMRGYNCLICEGPSVTKMGQHGPEKGLTQSSPAILWALIECSPTIRSYCFEILTDEVPQVIGMELPGHDPDKGLAQSSPALLLVVSKCRLPGFMDHLNSAETNFSQTIEEIIAWCHSRLRDLCDELRTERDLMESSESLWDKADRALTSTNDNHTKPKNLANRRQRKRLWLPLIVFTDTQEGSTIACPDSGSDDNIMSRKLADQLGLQIMDIRDPTPPIFVMTNGRTVSAIGQVRLKCAFKQGSPVTSPIDCVFYVFQTLAVPVIMGVKFLHATETLTKHRDRLVEELVPPTRPLRVCSIGRMKRDVVCRVGNYVGCATADTGSDLDLVSPSFAACRNFNVENSSLELEFADGSTGRTMGMIKTEFSIGRVSDVVAFIPRSEERSLEIFVLDNLNADILVSADTTQALQAFSGHEDCFVPAIPRLGESNLNIIRYIGTVERGCFKIWRCLKDPFISSEKKQAVKRSESSSLVVRLEVSGILLTYVHIKDANRSGHTSMTSYFVISSIIEIAYDPRQSRRTFLGNTAKPSQTSLSLVHRLGHRCWSGHGGRLCDGETVLLTSKTRKCMNTAADGERKPESKKN